GVDLRREDLEGGDGVDADVDGRGDGVGRAHRARPWRSLRRSACSLNAPSCSLQNASTWSNHACRAANGSRPTRKTRKRASASTPVASTSPPARSTRRCRLIAGALISAEAARSPARRGPVRNRSTTCRRVGSDSAENVTPRSLMIVSMLASSTWSMLRARAARDVQGVAGLVHDGAVPHTPRHAARVSCREGDDPLALVLLEHHVDRARQEADDLVPGRMHLPEVPVLGVVERAYQPTAVELGAAVDRVPELVVDFDGQRLGAVL